MKLEISNHQRSKKIIMTDEARVLKRLREERRLSLRDVGQRLGKSHATIAHIEGGRMNAPEWDRLMELLTVYGISDYKVFYDRVRHFSERRTPQDELRDLVMQLAPDRITIALEILKQVAEGRRIISVSRELQTIL